MNSQIKKYLPRCLATQSFLLGSSPASADSCDDESERAGDAVHERASKNRSRRHIYWHYQKGTPKKPTKKKNKNKKTTQTIYILTEVHISSSTFGAPVHPFPRLLNSPGLVERSSPCSIRRGPMISPVGRKRVATSI